MAGNKANTKPLTNTDTGRGLWPPAGQGSAGRCGRGDGPCQDAQGAQAEEFPAFPSGSPCGRHFSAPGQWSGIEPLLPNKLCSVLRVDNRRVPNGIYRRLRTGSQRSDTPERYTRARGLRQPLCPLGQVGRLDSDIRRDVRGLRWVGTVA